MDRNRRVSGRSGFALIAVIVFLGIVTIFGSAFFAAVNRQIDSVMHQEWNDVCVCLAEAGVDKAVAELGTNASYTGETDTPLGDGFFTVTVEPASRAGEYRIASIGKLSRDVPPRAEARIEAVARLDGGRVAAFRWEEGP